MKNLALILCIACNIFCVSSSVFKELFDGGVLKEGLMKIFSEETNEYIDCIIKFMRKDKFLTRFKDEIERIDYDEEGARETFSEYFLLNYEKCSYDNLNSDLREQLKGKWPNESDEVIGCVIKKVKRDHRFGKIGFKVESEADILNAYRVNCSISARNFAAAQQSIDELFLEVRTELKEKYPEESEKVIDCTIKEMRTSKFVTNNIKSAFADKMKAKGVIKKFVSGFYKKCKIPIEKTYTKENLQKLFPDEDEKIIKCIEQKVQNGEFLLRISSANAASLSSEQIEIKMRDYINTSNAECIKESNGASSSARRLRPIFKKFFDDAYGSEIKKGLMYIFSEETDEYIDCIIKFMRKDKFLTHFGNELERAQNGDEEARETFFEYLFVNYEKCSYDELHLDLKNQLKGKWPNESEEVIECIIKKNLTSYRKPYLSFYFEYDKLDAYRAKCLGNTSPFAAAHQSIDEVFSEVRAELKRKYPEESESVIDCTIKEMRTNKFVASVLKSDFAKEMKAKDVILKFVNGFYKKCKIPIAKNYTKKNLQKLFPEEDEKIIKCIEQKIQNGEFLLRISSANAATLSSEEIESKMRDYINTSNAECNQESIGASSSPRRLNPIFKKSFDKKYANEVKDGLKLLFSEETDECIDCMIKLMRKDKFLRAVSEFLLLLKLDIIFE